MDQTLVDLFQALSYRIEELKAKNPDLDMEDVQRGAILIQSYLDGFKTYTLDPESPPLREITYEEICKITRPPRTIPEGHLGPSIQMSKYAEALDNKRARRVDIVIKYGKDLEKNKDKPYF